MMGVGVGVWVFVMFMTPPTVAANNASWPRAGPSWLSDDFENDADWWQEPTSNNVDYVDEDIRNALATYVCDVAMESVTSPTLQFTKTDAFRELKRSLEAKLNRRFTNKELKMKIYYFNHRSPLTVGRVSWRNPDARAALIRFKNELELERKFFSTNQLPKYVIVQTQCFKTLKCSIEAMYGHTFEELDLLDRAESELRYMRRRRYLRTQSSTLTTAHDASSASASSSAHASASVGDRCDQGDQCGTSSNAEGTSYSNPVESPAMDAVITIEWSHPLVVSAFSQYQIDPHMAGGVREGVRSFSQI